MYNQVKIQINKQIYALINADCITLITVETGKTIIHIPRYVMSRLNALQSILNEDTRISIKQDK